MSKAPLRLVPSDDCAVEIEGVEYHPHEGEWVKVIDTFSVGTMRLIRCMAELASKIDSVEDDGTVAQIVMMDDTMTDLVAILQERVVEWSWTDGAGMPLPQPHHNPVAFRPLNLAELLYLGTTVRGESPGEEKNASTPSPTSSSATPRRRSRKRSGGGHSQ